MKQLISRSLAYVGQQCPRVTWLAVLPLAMSLRLAFTPLASPALAASNSHTTSHLAATKPASSIRVTQMGHVSVTSTVLTAPRDSAGDPCKQVSFQENYLVAGNVVAWLKMVTNWCYDNVIVTSHSTILYWGVTAYGNVLGWQSVGNPLYRFNCFVVSPGLRPCSGNHEYADQLFDNVPTLNGIGLTVDEWETYQGKLSPAPEGDSRFCLGGCTN